MFENISATSFFAANIHPIKKPPNCRTALAEEWRSSPRLASAFLKKWRGSAGTLLDVMETMARQAVDAWPGLNCCF